MVKLNIDENPATAARYGIMAIPTMNVYQGGEVVKTIVGAKPKAAIERDLAEFSPASTRLAVQFGVADVGELHQQARGAAAAVLEAELLEPSTTTAWPCATTAMPPAPTSPA